MRTKALVSLLIALVLASACARSAGSGAGDGPTAPASPSAFPVTVHPANGSVTIPQRPGRIVSLSPTATEMLFAIGAGPQVVAVDNDSNYPAQAPITKLSGYQPNVEAIATYDPDLAVISNDSGGLVRSFQRLGIPVLLEPAAAGLDDTYGQIEQLGRATGHGAGAAHQVASMQDAIRRLLASSPTFDPPLTYYHELDQTYYTATSHTFIGHLYGLLGLHNIADRAKGAASGYPQLSAEYIVKADPDIIFLADTKCCGQTAKTAARRPGWKEVSAVVKGAVVPLDDDIASRWGPRVVDFLRTAVQALVRLHQQGTT